VNNVFFGRAAGFSNTTGNNNAYFGTSAGFFNTAGGSNAFFGVEAGTFNTATGNSFFGRSAGKVNTTGAGNAFFGFSAGEANTTGNNNAFFGHLAGQTITTGSDNAFFGQGAGFENVTGNNNVYFGRRAGSNATGSNNSFFGKDAGFGQFAGSSNTLIGYKADVGADNLSHATAIGADAKVSNSNTIALGREDGSDRVRIYGNLFVNSLNNVGFAVSLCHNTGTGQIATCASSARYKQNIASFHKGLDLLNRLRPVTFDWKNSTEHDLGLIAEDVAKVEPLLVTHDKEGAIQGVKYAQLNVVLINAIKEQQTQLASYQRQATLQQEQLKRQEKRLESQQRQIEKLQHFVSRVRAKQWRSAAQPKVKR